MPHFQIGTLWDVIQAGGVSQIHHYIDKRHQQLGPIFREKLGHVEAVWLADPSFYQQVYQNEGACPRPMLPEPWIIFNRIHNYKRGLFFMYVKEGYYFFFERLTSIYIHIGKVKNGHITGKY